MGTGDNKSDRDAISTDQVTLNEKNSLKENPETVANLIGTENRTKSINGEISINDCASNDNETKENSTEKESENGKQLEKKPFEFKLRVIPIERLLEKPPVKAVVIENTILETNSRPHHKEKVISPAPLKKVLPERKNRAKISIIELSDTESDTDIDSYSCKVQEKTKRNTNKSTSRPSVIEDSSSDSGKDITSKCKGKKIVTNGAKGSDSTSSDSSVKNNKKENRLSKDSNNESKKLVNGTKDKKENKISDDSNTSDTLTKQKKNNKNDRNKEKFQKQRTSCDSENNSIKNKNQKQLISSDSSVECNKKKDRTSKHSRNHSNKNNNKRQRKQSSSNSDSSEESVQNQTNNTVSSDEEIIFRRRNRRPLIRLNLPGKLCAVRVRRIKCTEKYIPLSEAITFIDKPPKKSRTKKMSQAGTTAKLYPVDIPTISNRLKTIADLSEEDSDYEPAQENSMKKDLNDSNSSQSDAKSSDEEVVPSRKKRVYAKDRGSSDDGSDFEPQEKQKRRRRIKKNSSESDDSDDKEKNKHKRKHIRKIIKAKDLDISTKTATKEEEERRRRIEERQRIYNKIYEKPDSVEVQELVLDFDPETKDPLLEVDKGLLKKLKPHQVAGVKFMWDACYETLKDSEDKPGSGCILAHCMGLGKTLQIVALSHTLLTNVRKTNVERVLIISPLSTLNNWAREYKHWMSFARKKHIEIYDISRYKDKQTRIFKLNEWFEEGGVCILGYDMYRILANEKAKGLRKKQREQLQQALVEPGPDLVICDEGHLLKNEKTSISKAVTKMRTKRRIVLTGTPLQNNLKEYYCMIQFIKPNLLGTYKEYMNRFVHPITNGQYTDSTERDIRLMKHRSHILHKMLEGCIQRRDYSVLAPYLPPKHEYVVYTTLSDLQQQLYEYYMITQRDLISSDMSGKGARLFQDFQDLRRIWTHPMNLRVNSDTVIRKRLMADNEDSLEDFICDDEEEEEAMNGSGSDTSVDSSKSFASGDGGSSTKGGLKKRKTRSNKNMDADDDSDCEILNPIVEKDDPSEWWKRFVEDKELNNLYHSPKLVILMSLLQQCEAIGDKLLVFSQSLQSLDVIEHFLSLIDSKTKGHDYEGNVGDFKGFWTPGVDYFRLDGSCSVEQRESMCKKFNDTTNIRARLFLISTRAGGLGINLVAANRVVIFDVSWNPSHDTQSIFRVYRFGQDKPCYIYRLIAIGTMEQKVYERQVTKQATAKRVIDEQQISRHYNQSDLQELYTYELKPSIEREIPILPKDRLFAELLTEHENILYKYHEHDSLLENEESENLSESERKAAWSEYEAEKTRSTQTAQYISYDRNAFGTQFMANAATGNVTSNKIFGFRSDVLLQLLNMKVAKDLPDLNQNQVIQLVPGYLTRLYTEMNNGDPSMYKDLLALHATLAHPSGFYMNPLLYANQNPQAAGYYQQGGQPGAPQQQGGPQQPGGPMQPPQPPRPAPGFDPNKVYEID